MMGTLMVRRKRAWYLLPRHVYHQVERVGGVCAGRREEGGVGEGLFV